MRNKWSLWRAGAGTLLVALIIQLVFDHNAVRMLAAPSIDSISKASVSSNAWPNFDVRLDAPVVSSPRQNESLNLSAATLAAQSRLLERVPGLKIEWSDVLPAPEIVGVSTERNFFLTEPSAASRERIVRDFLVEFHSLYGLTRLQISALEKISDYLNPEGNLMWVEFQQKANGIPVFQGELRAALTRKNELVRTVSRLSPGLDYRSLKTRPGISDDELLTGAHLDLGGAPTDNADTRIDPASLKLTYFPLGIGEAKLAWSFALWHKSDAYLIVVDSDTGRLLFRNCISYHQTQSATYSIYDNDSPAPLSPSNVIPGGPQNVPGISRSSLTNVSELPMFDNLGWITDGVNMTSGNNADAGLDLVPPIGIDPDGRPIGNPFRVFNFSYNPPPIGNDPPTGTSYRFGSVTNLFFWANRIHDRLYQAGFTEPSRNAQLFNFGRGGVEGDPVLVQVMDDATALSTISTPPDGTSPIFRAGVTIGLDQEVTAHEFFHIVSSRLHGNGTGLGTVRSGSMGEGWSDFFARSLVSTADEDVGGYFATAAYMTNQALPTLTTAYYYGIRRFPYAVKTSIGGPLNRPHNPLTFADIDPAQMFLGDGAYPPAPWIGSPANEVHNAGEVWCMALLEVRARLIRRLGFDLGNRRMLQLVVDGMKLDPLNPNFLQGRDAIITADLAGFGGADVHDIWAGFAFRGMGVGAQDLGMSVVQSFVAPGPNPRADFDGDARTDISVYRTGTWYIQRSTAGFIGVGFGLATDTITPGDYDGDGKTDLAVFRNAGGQGTWYILKSTDSSLLTVSWGLSGDITRASDYDGDGKTDVAIYRPSSNTYYVRRSSDLGLSAQTWGIAGDIPAVADFDGDGRADFGVFRSGTWHILATTAGYSATPFGLTGDRLVPADFDGDAKADIAVFRAGTWYVQGSRSGFITCGWGEGADILAPGDYDGDGIDDAAVFRGSTGTWYVRNSAGGTTTTAFGTSGDTPVPAAFVP